MEKFGAVHRVVIGDVFFQFFAGMPVDGRVGIDVEIGLADHAIGVFVVFVGGKSENSGDAQIMLACLLFGLENIVVLDERFDAADAENGRKLQLVGFAAVVVDDVVRDLIQPLRRLEQFPGVNVFYRNIEVVFGAVFLAVAPDVFDGEFEDVLVFDGIGDDVLMQALLEEFFGGAFAQFVAHGVVGKNGRTRETEHLAIVEKGFDAVVGVAELAAVALVEDENDALVAQLVHTGQIGLLADGGVEFLDGGDDEAGIVGELADQGVGVAGAVHAAIGEVVELLRGLVVEVVAIHHENDLMHLGQFHQHLRRFERRERFAGAGGVPDVAVVDAVLHAVDDGLGGKILVGPEDHQHLVGLMQHDVLADHFGEVAFLQKGIGKRFDAGNGAVVFVGPVEGLFERLAPVVGVVLGVDAVADDKHLHVLEQAQVSEAKEWRW